MEAWGLGTFMVAAGLAVMLFEYPASPLREMFASAALRRALVGIAMGLTAVAIIYSPWGKQSGAHLNPAVTLALLRLCKVGRQDALFYIVAQFTGGAFGVALLALLFGQAFTQSPVAYLVTVPGPAGPWTAFAAEVAISCGLMLVVLIFMNSQRLAHAAGLAAGVLIAVYIAVESPLSGMSMNPARTFASAASSGIWDYLWIYLTAPILGMWLAVDLHAFFEGSTTAMCAKLDHPNQVRCIHCGYGPPAATQFAGQSSHCHQQEA